MLPFERLKTLAAGKREVKNDARDYILQCIMQVGVGMAERDGHPEVAAAIKVEARKLAKSWGFNHVHGLGDI